MTRFLRRRLLRLLSLGSLAVLSLAPLAAQSPDNPLPAPSHPIDFGYYKLDAPKYKDAWHQVNCYTNLYYVGVEEDYQCSSNPPDPISFWLPKMQASLARAAAENKRLLVDLALNSPAMMTGDSSLTPELGQVLDALAPYWSKVAYLELADEPLLDPNPNRPNELPWDDQRVDRVALQIEAQLALRGLSQRPFGITLTRGDLRDPRSNNPKHASKLGWIGIEAYLCPPGGGCGSSTAISGNADPATNSQILLDTLATDKSYMPLGKQIVLVMQAYTLNGAWQSYMPALVAMQSATYLAAYDDPRVVAINMFSYARPSGTLDNPQLNQPHRWIAERLYNATYPGLCSSLPPVDVCSGTPLGAPAGLAASPSGFQVSLTWQDGSSDETGFEVERLASGSWSRIATLGINSTSYTDSPPAPPAGGSVSYSYRVRAIRGTQASSYSNTASATLWADPPSAVPSPVGPSGCTTSTLPTYQWTSVPRATRYYLVATRADVESFFINNSNVTGTSFPQPTALTAGVQYRWKVKACNNAGCAAYTPSIYFTPFCAPTQAPNLVSPQGCTASLQPTLTWSSVAGATQYKIAVYRVVDVNNDVLTYYQDVPGTSFTPPAPLLAGQEYRFKVKAKAGTQDGPFSRHRYFTPQCAANQRPGTVSPIAPWFASVSGTSPTFLWEVASNTVDYLLRVNAANGTVLHQQWYPAASICSGAECSIQPPLSLPAGSYGWQVQTRNATGVWPWAVGTTFTVP